MKRKSFGSVLRSLCRVWLGVGLVAGGVSSGAAAQGFDVPSGQPVQLQEVLLDTVADQSWLRFRFVAPQIARVLEQIDYETADVDMTHLCAEMALQYIVDFELEVDVIVISLADRETEFGSADPEATQFFEAYRPQGDACIWEGL